MSTTETSVIATELGLPVPYLPHAVSVSLPTWQNNLDYAEGEARVVGAMTTGYPRFVIHRSIQLVGWGSLRWISILTKLSGCPHSSPACARKSSEILKNVACSYQVPNLRTRVIRSSSVTRRLPSKSVSPITPCLPQHPTVSQKPPTTARSRKTMNPLHSSLWGSTWFSFLQSLSSWPNRSGSTPGMVFQVDGLKGVWSF